MNIDESLELTYKTVMSKIKKLLGESSGWLTDSVNSHFINISKYLQIGGSSYIALPEKLKSF